MDAVAELDEILRRSRRPHYVHHEQKRGKLWVFTHKLPCFCHINEDHWIERIV